MNGFENVPVSCIGCRCDDETSTFYIQFLETIKFGRRIQFVLCVDNTPLEVTISATTASMMSILPANTRLALPVAATTQSISVNNNLSPEQRPRVPNLLNLPVVKIPSEMSGWFTQMNIHADEPSKLLSWFIVNLVVNYVFFKELESTSKTWPTITPHETLSNFEKGVCTYSDMQEFFTALIGDSPSWCGDCIPAKPFSSAADRALQNFRYKFRLCGTTCKCDECSDEAGRPTVRLQNKAAKIATAAAVAVATPSEAVPTTTDTTRFQPGKGEKRRKGGKGGKGGPPQSKREKRRKGGKGGKGGPPQSKEQIVDFLKYFFHSLAACPNQVKVLKKLWVSPKDLFCLSDNFNETLEIFTKVGFERAKGPQGRAASKGEPRVKKNPPKNRGLKILKNCRPRRKTPAVPPSPSSSVSYAGFPHLAAKRSRKRSRDGECERAVSDVHAKKKMPCLSSTGSRRSSSSRSIDTTSSEASSAANQSEGKSSSRSSNTLSDSPNDFEACNCEFLDGFFSVVLNCSNRDPPTSTIENVDAVTTLAQFHDLVANTTNVDAKEFTLKFKEKVLSRDCKTLEDVEIRAGSVIDMAVKTKGGGAASDIDCSGDRSSSVDPIKQEHTAITPQDGFTSVPDPASTQEMPRPAGADPLHDLGEYLAALNIVAPDEMHQRDNAPTESDGKNGRANQIASISDDNVRCEGAPGDEVLEGAERHGGSGGIRSVVERGNRIHTTVALSSYQHSVSREVEDVCEERTLSTTTHLQPRTISTAAVEDLTPQGKDLRASEYAEAASHERVAAEKADAQGHLMNQTNRTLAGMGASVFMGERPDVVHAVVSTVVSTGTALAAHEIGLAHTAAEGTANSTHYAMHTALGVAGGLAASKGDLGHCIAGGAKALAAEVIGESIFPSEHQHRVVVRGCMPMPVPVGMSRQPADVDPLHDLDESLAALNIVSTVALADGRVNIVVSPSKCCAKADGTSDAPVITVQIQVQYAGAVELSKQCVEMACIHLEDGCHSSIQQQSLDFGRVVVLCSAIWRKDTSDVTFSFTPIQFEGKELHVLAEDIRVVMDIKPETVDIAAVCIAAKAIEVHGFVCQDGEPEAAVSLYKHLTLSAANDVTLQGCLGVEKLECSAMGAFRMSECCLRAQIVDFKCDLFVLTSSHISAEVFSVQATSSLLIESCKLEVAKSINTSTAACCAIRNSEIVCEGTVEMVNGLDEEWNRLHAPAGAEGYVGVSNLAPRQLSIANSSIFAVGELCIASQYITLSAPPAASAKKRYDTSTTATAAALFFNDNSTVGGDARGTLLVSNRVILELGSNRFGTSPSTSLSASSSDAAAAAAVAHPAGQQWMPPHLNIPDADVRVVAQLSLLLSGHGVISNEGALSSLGFLHCALRGSICNLGTIVAHGDVDVEVHDEYISSGSGAIASNSSCVTLTACTVSLSQEACVSAAQDLSLTCRDLHLHTPEAKLVAKGDIQVRTLHMMNRGRVHSGGTTALTIGVRANQHVISLTESARLRTPPNAYFKEVAAHFSAPTPAPAAAAAQEKSADQGAQEGGDSNKDKNDKNNGDGKNSSKSGASKEGEGQGRSGGGSEGDDAKLGYPHEGELVNLGGVIVGDAAVHITASSRVSNARSAEGYAAMVLAASVDADAPAAERTGVAAEVGLICSPHGSVEITAEGDIHNDYAGTISAQASLKLCSNSRNILNYRHSSIKCASEKTVLSAGNCMLKDLTSFSVAGSLFLTM